MFVMPESGKLKRLKYKGHHMEGSSGHLCYHSFFAVDSFSLLFWFILIDDFHSI